MVGLINIQSRYGKKSHGKENNVRTRLRQNTLGSDSREETEAIVGGG